MKEGWERTGQPVLLDLKQINDIVGPAILGTKVIAAERLGVGFRNSNYKIYLDGQPEPLVLRLYTDGEETAGKELAIAGLVRETVPVADFLYADTSCTAYSKPWAMMEWKQGIHLHDVFRTGTEEQLTSAAASIGSTLARIHAFAFPVTGFFSKDLTITQPFHLSDGLFLSMIEDSLFHKSCGKWLGAELTEALWEFCRLHAPVLSEADRSPVLVHSDFNGLNILMEQDGQHCSVSAVLDWEFAFSFSRYIDIGNMLRYEEEGSLFEQHFITAYQEHGGELDKNWKLIAKLEDLTALCDMLNHSTVNTPIRLRDLQRLVMKTVRTYR